MKFAGPDLLRWGVAFDTETAKTQPGLSIPPLVCAAVAKGDGEKVVGRFLAENEGEDPYEGRVLAALRTFKGLLIDKRVILVLANAPYDLLVMAREAALRGDDLMPAIWMALGEERIYDVLTAEKLHGIAFGMLGKDPRTGMPLMNRDTGRRGGYNLDNVTEIRTGRVDAKERDIYRTSYWLLRERSTTEWLREHPDAVQYPVDDVCNTLTDALSQVGAIASPAPHEWPKAGAQRCLHCNCGFSFDLSKLPACPPRPNRAWNLHDLSRQVAAHVALKLGAVWGFRVDQRKVDELEARVTKGRADRAQKFLAAGLLKWRKKDGVIGLGRDMSAIKKALALAYGCTGKCTTCDGIGKVPKPKLPAFVIADPAQWDPNKHGNNCKACGATGLDLDSAPVPMTDPKNPDSDPTVGTGRDPLDESGDELLMDFADYLRDAKIVEVYIPWLRSARKPHPRNPGEWIDIPLTLYPNEVLETGRVSYYGVVQLLPRAGGVRECIVARVGKVFATVDFESGELFTHAENCIQIVGWSKLADALNANLKIHNALAATILGISYEEFNARLAAGDPLCKAVRQAVKPANFGFPGRMGSFKLVQQQRKQGPDTACKGGPAKIKDDDGNLVDGFRGLRFCILMDGATYCGRHENGDDCKIKEWHRHPIPPTCKRCIDCAERLRDGWLNRQWTENDLYFQWVQQMEENGQPLDDDDRRVLGDITLGPGQIIQHFTKRIRGGTQGNAIANGYFQGLLAEAAKDALVEVQRECTDPTLGSVLYGSRVVLFAHDELIVEVPEDTAHECAHRISEIMVKWLRHYCPHVAQNCAAEPALMSAWWKGAAPKWRDGGKKSKGPDDRLVPWAPN